MELFAWFIIIPFALLLLTILFNWIVKKRPLKGILNEVKGLFAWRVSDAGGPDWKLTVFEPQKSWYHVDLNPGLIVRHADGTWDYVLRTNDPEQRLFACFRRCTLMAPVWNQTCLCELDTKTHGVINGPSVILSDPRLEDARLFQYRRQLFASVDTLQDVLMNTKQVVAPINFRNTRPKVIKSNLNNYVSESQTEKNWQFFEHDNRMYVIYSVQPFRVFELQDFDSKRKVADHEWSLGHVHARGGTPPVRLGKQWYMVTHSKDYKMRAVTFDDSFRITKCTNKPLLNLPGHYIHFPCGLVYDERKDAFLVSTGINNKQVGILTVQKSHVDSLLERVF